MLIYHVDDSSYGIRMFAHVVTEAFPDARVVSFENAHRLLTFLSEGKERPALVVVDDGLLDLKPSVVLDRIKRDPRSHRIPVAIACNPWTVASPLPTGFLGRLIKPHEVGSVRPLLLEAKARYRGDQEVLQGDLSFSQELRQWIRNFDSSSMNTIQVEIMRLHLLKRQALELQFPTLIPVFGTVERLLFQLCEAAADRNAESASRVFIHLVFLAEQADRIAKGEVLREFTSGVVDTGTPEQ